MCSMYCSPLLMIAHSDASLHCRTKGLIIEKVKVQVAYQLHMGPWGAHTPVAAMIRTTYPPMGLRAIADGTHL